MSFSIHYHSCTAGERWNYRQGVAIRYLFSVLFRNGKSFEGNEKTVSRV
jgi:hypothetical protein